MTERTESADMIEPAATQLAMDPTEPKQPTEPTDSTDPMLPMDRIEPLDPMERIDPVDLIDISEQGGLPSRGDVALSGTVLMLRRAHGGRRLRPAEPVAQRARATHSAARAITRRGSRRGPRVPNRFWSPGTTTEAPRE